MTDFQKKFGARVKELRKRRGYTQEVLAEKVNIGVRSLGKIENGNSFPSCETLEKLIVALQTTNLEIFDFEHLQSEQNLKEKIFEMVNSNPERISDIYKIVKAIVV